MKGDRKTDARSSASHSDGSAAQPAPKAADNMYPSRPAQPTVRGPTHKLAFNNVGWQTSDKKHDAAWLARKVSDIVTKRNVDAVGISEIFSQGHDDLKPRKQDIMSELLGQLNQGRAEQSAWEGRTDVHYISLWNSSRLRLVNYEVISCGITEHPNRRAQYFELHSTENDFPLHLYHNHSPSPTLTLARRKT